MGPEVDLLIYLHLLKRFSRFICFTVLPQFLISSHFCRDGSASGTCIVVLLMEIGPPEEPITELRE